MDKSRARNGQVRVIKSLAIDRETRRLYFITKEGSLHMLGLPRMLISIAMSATTRFDPEVVGSAHFNSIREGRIILPDLSARWGVLRNSQSRWAKIVSNAIAKYGLYGVVRGLLIRAQRKQLRSSLRKHQIVLRTSLVWKYSIGDACLARSLFRIQWLARHGLSSTLKIGCHFPTNQMHAWVETDGLILGEEPDELFCYVPLLTFNCCI